MRDETALDKERSKLSGFAGSNPTRSTEPKKSELHPDWGWVRFFLAI